MTRRERQYVKKYYKTIYNVTDWNEQILENLYNTWGCKAYLLHIEFTLLKKTIWRIIKRHIKESKKFYKNFDKYGV